jgi:PEGA domain
MGFYQEYELLGLVHDGPTKTLRAREIATDRAVFLHLLTGALSPDAQKSLLERVDGLIGRSSGALKIGEFAGTRYVVTDILEPFTNLELWVRQADGSQEASPRSDAPHGSPGPHPDAPQPHSIAGPPGQSGSPIADGPIANGPMPNQPVPSFAGALDSAATGADAPPPNITAAPNIAQPSMLAQGPSAEAQQPNESDAAVPAPGQLEADSGQAEAGSPAPAHGSQERSATTNGLTTALADEPRRALGDASADDVPPNGAPPAPANEVPPDRALRELTGSLQGANGEAAANEIRAHLDQAKQHLENDAVRNALDSLESALQLRPDHPEALRMVHEVQRMDDGRPPDEELQAQKEWYYQKAREHWEAGDLEATLDELDRLLALEEERPSPQNGRGRIYREFQSQVHAESEGLSSSYAEARAQMAEENLDAALSICDRCLAKFPNHALFQALRFDIGERKRQEALAFIADTDRRIDAEPDLEQRIQILQQALQRHPGEKHFEEAVRLIREKQQLVRSIIDKAGALEQSQRFREALDQWQLMESVHAQLPGLQGNVKRLEQRLQEHRVHQEARGRWVSQSKRCLQAGDYEQALKLVRNALEECPEDPELRQLELEAGQGLQRVDTIRDHLRQAQQLWHAGRRPEGLDRLRQAHQLDPRNTLVRGELVNALVELARHQVESDWATAQPLVEEILRLEPNHTVAVHLLEQAGRQKREEMISWSLVEARRLRSQGQLEQAYGLVCDYLRQYPEEDRLLQLEASLAQDLDPSLVSAIQSQGEPTSPEDDQALDAGYTDDTTGDAYQDQPAWDQNGAAYDSAAPDAEGYDEPLADTGSPTALEQGELYADSADEPEEAYAASVEEGDEAGPYAYDDIDSGGPFADENAVPQDLPEGAAATAGFEPGWRTTAADDEDLLSRLASDSATASKTGKPQPKTALPQAAKTSLLVSLQEKCALAVAPLRRLLAAKHFKAVGRTWPVMPTLLGMAAAVALLGILGTVLIWRFTSAAPEAPAGAALVVTVQSSPPGAALTVDGKPCPSPCQLELPAASHRVEANLPGYRAAAVSFDLSDKNAGQPVVVTLLPLLPVLQVSSDLASGALTLDGNRIGELEDGGFDQELDQLGPGEHTLRVAGQGSSAALTFEITAGEAPKFTAPPDVSSLKGILIAGLGGVAQVYGTETGETLALDGQPVGKLGSDGLVLDNLSEGTHELTLGSGKQQRKFVFDSTPAPLLAAYLSSDRNVGTLRVNTAEDGVQIFLNGTAYRYKTLHGRRLIYLHPKRYEVRVEKDGFRSPEVQTVEINKGEEARLDFELSPLPQTATLRIANGISGTEVWIDGQSRGVIRSGAFTSTVEPGKHAIRLENENYKTTELEREFGAGSTVDLDGTLESAVGTLEIQVNPPDADVSLTLQREGENAPRPIHDKTLQLPPGTYTVQAAAPGFHDYAATVRITINQTKTASLILRKVEEKKPDQPTVTLADWEKAGWRRDDNLLVRHGGDFVVAPATGGAGRYTFTALLQKGRRLEWVVDYSDADNYVLYQLGKDFLHRTEVVKGKKSRTVKIPHQMKWDDFLSIDIAVTPDSIVHRVLIDDKWVELDNWKQPGSSFTTGKFGFHIPGRDQIGLSHFAFIPQH